MRNGNYFGQKVFGSEEDSVIGDLPVDRESHGLVIGVLFPPDSALAVTLDGSGFKQQVIQIFAGIRNYDRERELHSFLGSFRQQHPVGDAALFGVLLEERKKFIIE